MKLSKEQEKRLKAGEYAPLYFSFEDHKTEPVQPQFKLVLDWTKASRTAAPDGHVTVAEPQPIRWIVITSVKRERHKGGWLVRYEVEDRREECRWLDRNGGYTTSRYRAVDELEVVPTKFQKRISEEASRRDHLVRLEAVAARRTERNRFRKERLKAANGFRSAA